MDIQLVNIEFSQVLIGGQPSVSTFENQKVLITLPSSQVTSGGKGETYRAMMSGKVEWHGGAEHIGQFSGHQIKVINVDTNKTVIEGKVSSQFPFTYPNDQDVQFDVAPA